MMKPFIFFSVCVLTLVFSFGQDAYLLEPRVNTDPSFTYTPSPDDWRDVNVYQLFTDRFFDGDPSNNNARSMRGGGIGWWGFNTSYGSGDTTGRSWYNTGNSAQANDRHLFQGGDWEGIRQKIPYLNAMGIKAVWLSSVQKVEQGYDKRFTPYHAYHPTDLYRCEPMFGDFAKLKQLIDELHANGIYVILDVVPNHMADLIRRTSGNENYAGDSCNTFDINWVDGVQHAAPFNRLDWFHCNGNIGNYDGYPETQLGGFKGTDDIATERADVQSELAIAFKNLIDATDCDGFRVDAIKHVDHNWIKSWASDMRAHAAFRGKDDFLIFGELFSFDDGFHRFFTGDDGSGFNSAMWFTMMNTMKSVFKDGGGTNQLSGQLNNIHNAALFGNEASPRSIAFIDNHDVDRVSKNQPLWTDMLRPAMGVLYCGTPVPTLFYGTEHGFNQGNANNDVGNDDADYQRECMWDFGYQWGNASGDKFAASSEIKDLIGQLNDARSQYQCLTRGSYTGRWEDGGSGIFAFTRTLGDQEALVILNTHWTDSKSATPTVSLADGTTYTDFLNTSDVRTVSGGNLGSISVPAKGLKVYIAGDPNQSGLIINNTRNYPVDGSIEATDTIYVDVDTTPKGKAVSGDLIYSTDGGTNWTTVALARNASFDTASTDAWNVSLGTFSAGTTVLYAVSFVDDEANTIWDNNNTSNYSFTVNTLGTTGPNFVMDGSLDSSAYLIVDNGMRIWAAVRGTKLYFATWSSEGGGSDHFLYLTDSFGNPEDHPWRTVGVSQANFWFSGKPWLAGEGDNNFATINNGGTSGAHAEGAGGDVLEGVVDLVEVFGSVPKTVYLSAVAHETNGGITSQAPASWNSNDNLDIEEMAAVHVESIRDEDADGYFDRAWPSMESEVSGDPRDANYDLRRFFVDELAGDSHSLTIRFTPNGNPAEAITNVELITNVNRRDQATIQEDLDTVTTGSNTYYRAYAMTESAGVYEATINITQCGAYRATVRYYVDGNGPFYYTDGGLRRDLAIVVSPKKALEVTMYEVNPGIVEATSDNFADRSTFRDLWMQNTDRPDAVSAQKFNDIGVNMLWLQPIHPIGVESRGTDPATSLPYDPGSPYAVQDYWKVSPALGASNTEANALSEFQTMVTQMDGAGVGVMMDGTFNHSAPDAVLGQGAVDLFGLTATDEIRNTRPGWYSKEGEFHVPAADASEVAVAPDRSDFGKWTDVRDFYFGDYDALVRYASPSHQNSYLLERDDVEPLTATTKEVWDYFAYYPLYWLDKTGHPVGTPASDSYKGIDGLRCDFAQGLPNEFWEYCINKTRSRKWDFLFMAESLDGFRTVNGNSRHGVGYRSARHFDILNENMVFYWRDTYFQYPANGAGSGGAGTKQTSNTEAAYDSRDTAFDDVVLLSNLTSHDEVFPSDFPYEIMTAYAQVSSLKGIPMIMYGQEAGAQNDLVNYGFTGDISNVNHNWSHYELNFGKGIPNFKRWNDMSNIWANRDTALEGYYGRINKARLASPALRNGDEIFLDTTGGGMDEDIFAVAKYESAGVSVIAQDVVLAFVNNDPLANNNRSNTFALGPHAATLGIDPSSNYNIVNLLADDPAAYVWGTDRTGQDLIDNGIFVLLNGATEQLEQAQYLKLVDRSNPDSDGDSLPDAWEDSYGLDSSDPNGIQGYNGDYDGDGVSNGDEWIAGTDPTVPSSFLRICGNVVSGNTMTLTWESVSGRDYRILESDDLQNWHYVQSGGSDALITAVGAQTSYPVDLNALNTAFNEKHFFRVEVLYAP